MPTPIRLPTPPARRTRLTLPASSRRLCACTSAMLLSLHSMLGCWSLSSAWLPHLEGLSASGLWSGQPRLSALLMVPQGCRCINCNSKQSFRLFLFYQGFLLDPHAQSKESPDRAQAPCRASRALLQDWPCAATDGRKCLDCMDCLCSVQYGSKSSWTWHGERDGRRAAWCIVAAPQHELCRRSQEMNNKVRHFSCFPTCRSTIGCP